MASLETVILLLCGTETTSYAKETPIKVKERQINKQAENKEENIIFKDILNVI
jgi:hypothetical protein